MPHDELSPDVPAEDELHEGDPAEVDPGEHDLHEDELAEQPLHDGAEQSLHEGDLAEDELDEELEEATAAASSHGVWWLVVRWLVLAALLALVYLVVLPAFTDVDYDAVGDAIRQLDDAELVAILATFVLRLLAEGAFVASVAPGLGVTRGTIVFVASSGVGATVPGPSDLVARFEMYRGWGFPIHRAGVAVSTSGLLIVTSKLALPVIALGLLAVSSRTSNDITDAAIVGAVVFVAAVVGIVVVLRSRRLAHRLGDFVGQVVSWFMTKVGRPPVRRLGERFADFRDDAVSRLATSWPQLTASTAFVHASRIALLLVIIRFVGIPESALDWALVLAADALVQLATVIPVTPGGAAVTEVVYIGFLTAWAGQEWVNEITAAVVLFRLLTWVLLIPLGWAALVGWRWARRRGRLTPAVLPPIARVGTSVR